MIPKIIHFEQMNEVFACLTGNSKWKSNVGLINNLVILSELSCQPRHRNETKVVQNRDNDTKLINRRNSRFYELNGTI